MVNKNTTRVRYNPQTKAGQPSVVQETYRKDLETDGPQTVKNTTIVRQQPGSNQGPQYIQETTQEERKGYWEDPYRVARYYNFVRSQPADWQAPDWMDTQAIGTAYEYMKFQNQDKPWTQWKPLSDTDPAISYLRSIQTPPSDYLLPVEDDDYIGDYESQYDQFMQERAQAQQQTAEAQQSTYADLMGSWDDLLPYEKLLNAFFSPQPGTMNDRPEYTRGTAAIFQGLMGGAGAGFLVSGLTANPLVGLGVGLGVAGLATYQAYSGVEIPVISEILTLLDIGAIGLERTIGLGAQAVYDKSFTEILNNFPEAWKAADLTYESSNVDLVNVFAAITGNKTAGPGEVFQIQRGISGPVPIQGSRGAAALVEARERMAKGEDAVNVYVDMVERFGFTGTLNDFVIQSIADPANLAGFMTGKAGSVISEAAGAKSLAAVFEAGTGNPLVDIAPIGVKQVLSAITGKTESAGLFDSLETFRKWATGGVTIEGMDTPKISEMSSFERWILRNDITPEGTIKELQPSQGKNWFGQLGELTPLAQATTYKNLAADQISLMISQFGQGNPDQMVDVLYRMADEQTPAEVGQRVESLNQQSTADLSPDEAAQVERTQKKQEGLLESPAAATVAGAIRAVVNNGKPVEMVTQWHAAEGKRSLLVRLSQLLDTDPGSVLEQVENDPDLLFRRIMDKQGNEDIKALIQSPEGLQNNLNVFIGEDKLPYHPDAFQAILTKTVLDDMDDYLVERFGLKPERDVIRVSNVLKGMQSLVLLGFNPGYFVNNLVNNMVTRAAQGVFGFMRAKDVNELMTRLELTPSRIDVGVGAEGDTRQSGTSKLVDAMRKDDAIEKMQKAVRAANDKLGVFSRLSSTMEAAESRNAYAIGTRQMWNKLWRKDSGFQAMPRSLELLLDQQYPGMKEAIYAAVESGMNMTEIQKAVSGRLVKPKVQEAIRETAEKMAGSGLDADTIEDVLISTGIADQLERAIQNAETENEIDQAFDAVQRRMNEFIDILSGQELEQYISDIDNRIQAEGMPAVLDAFAELQLRVEHHWLSHFAEWEQVMADAESMNPQIRGDFIRAHTEKNRIDWDRRNAIEVNTMNSIIQALNITTDASRKYVETIMDNHDLWKSFYVERSKKYYEFFVLQKKNMGDWRVISKKWKELQAEMMQFYKTTNERSIKLLDEADNQFVQMYADYTAGDGPNSQAWRTSANKALAWRENVKRYNKDRQKSMEAFRESMAETNLTPEQKRKAWTEFIQKTYNVAISEIRRAEVEGSYNLVNGVPIEVRPESEVGTAQQQAQQAIDEAKKIPGPLDEPQQKVQPQEEVTPRGKAILGMLDDYKTVRSGKTFGINGLAHALNIINKYSEQTFSDINQVDVETALNAFDAWKAAHMHETVGDMVKTMLDAEAIRLEADAARRETIIKSQGMQTREDIKTWFAEQFTNLTPAQIDAGMILIDARADAWAEKQGWLVNAASRAAYYATHLAVVNGLDSGSKLLQQAWNNGKPLSFDEFINLDFGTLESGSRSPSRVFNYDRSEYETLFDLVSDNYRLREVLGDGYDEKPNLKLIPKIRKNEKITVYRSADTGGILPGSFVSESFNYVQEHGERSISNDYKVYKLEVYPDELLTYDDPHEFIYVPRDRQEAYQRYLQQYEQGEFFELDDNLLIKKRLSQVYGPEDIQQIDKGELRVISDGRSIIRGFEASDVSTFVHEIGHLFRRDLMDTDLQVLIRDSGQSITVEAYREIDQRYWSNDPGMSQAEKESYVAVEETFARAFERYVADGKAPTSRLKAIFKKFSDWILQIYKKISGSEIDIKISPELKDVFDRLLTSEQSEDPEISRLINTRAEMISQEVGRRMDQKAILEQAQKDVVTDLLKEYGSLEEAETAGVLNVELAAELAKENQSLNPFASTGKQYAEGKMNTARSTIDPRKEYEFVYRVYELDDLIASDVWVGDQLKSNPKYDQRLQERARDQAGSVSQANVIAATLVPAELIDETKDLSRGAPIIGPDRMVESGNGRTISLMRAAETYPENYTAYRNYLVENAGQLGIDAGEFEGYAKPVLVRERVSDVDRYAFTREGNASATLKKSTAEVAKTDAKYISAEMLKNLDITENETIEQAISSTKNNGFIRAFLEKMPANERNAVSDNGSLNAEGVRRIIHAILASVFTGKDGEQMRNNFINSLHLDVQAARTAIYQALPQLIQAEGMMKLGTRNPDLSIMNDLAVAVNTLADIRNNPNVSLTDYLNQMNLFADDALTPIQIEFLRYIGESGANSKRIRMLLREYAMNIIEKEPDPNQMGLFGGLEMSRTKEEILSNATETIRKEYESRGKPKGQSDLFAGTETQPEGQTVPGAELAEPQPGRSAEGEGDIGKPEEIRSAATQEVLQDKWSGGLALTLDEMKQLSGELIPSDNYSYHYGNVPAKGLYAVADRKEGTDIVGTWYQNGKAVAVITKNFSDYQDVQTRLGTFSVLGQDPDGGPFWIAYSKQSGEFRTISPYNLSLKQQGQPAQVNRIFQKSEQGVPPVGDLPLGQTPTVQPHAQMLDEVAADVLNPVLGQLKQDYKAKLDERRQSQFGDLDENGNRQLKRWLGRVQTDMASTKLAAMRYGEQMRDGALLNYDRRYGIDTYANMVFPYQFWYTRSLMKWAQRMVDKPAWFAMYARLQEAEEKMKMQGVPSRFAGKMRINMPFLPDWMGGGMWVDPKKQLLPFANFTSPLDQIAQDENQIGKRAEYLLTGMVENGQITQAEKDQALQSKAGGVWDMAYRQAEVEINGGSQNQALDMASMIMSPALWVNIPMKIANGKPEEISTLPITRTGRAVQTALKGTWLEPLGNLAGSALAGPETAIRKAAGLNEFGEWGDYYIDRQLSNMAADGVVSAEDALVAMMEKDGPAYDMAVMRVRQEEMVRTPGGLALNQLGKLVSGQADVKDVVNVPVGLSLLFGGGLLPSGELKQRGLQDVYNQAWDDYGKGDDKALDDFFTEHPEYETRLALWAEPEERLREFLINEIWTRYFDLPESNRTLARSQLGDLFQTAFLDGTTRDYDMLDDETLAWYAQTLGGRVPRTESAQAVMDMPAFQQQELQVYPDSMVETIETYQAERDKLYPAYRAMQEIYFSLPEGPGERETFLERNPGLQNYWQWKEYYLQANPQIKTVLDEYETTRESQYPDYATQQEAYFSLPERSAERRNYLSNNPSLKEYWDWRTQWYKDHPEMTVYEDDRERLFPDINILQELYYSLPESDTERKAFLEANPSLGEYWQWKELYKSMHPEMEEYFTDLESNYQNQSQKVPLDVTGEPAAQSQLLTDEQKQEFSSELMQSLVMYVYADEEMSGGANAELKSIWNSFGKPDGSLQGWLQARVIPSFFE